MLMPSAWATTPAATKTTLSISATTVPYKTPITLTATVTSGGSPVSAGLVIFCDSTAPFCETNSALAMTQLTYPAATASVTLGSGPLGNHSYKAMFLPNNVYATSVSNAVSYSVQGTYDSTTAIGSTGSAGNYTLSGTVAGIGSTLAGPTGSVSFLDTSVGNNVLGTQAVGTAILSNTFASAPGSPFAIGATNTPGQRSVAIASAFLQPGGHLDVITGDQQQTITVLLGNGDGTFQPKLNYPGCPTGKALKILLADFNRDGNADVALGCSDSMNGSLTILLGNGDGSFQAPVAYTAGDVAGIAMGDFNGDGIIDMAVSNHMQQNVMIFLGNGDGTFQPGTVQLSPSAELHDVVVGDFNSDGRYDLVFAVNTAVANSALSDLYLATGKGDGTFNTPVQIASQIGEFLTAGDTNADNKTDVISTTITGTSNTTTVGNSLFVLIGNGDGTFQPKVTYVSDIPSDPHLTDVNGDGKADIIAGGSYGALVYQGNGDGTFQPYTEPSIGGFALTYAVNAGDFNDDGNADLVGTDAKSLRAAVSLSEVQQTAQAAALAGVALYPLGSGTHYVDASYSGDSIFLTSLSSTIPLLAAPTPTTLTLSVAPTSATLIGQNVSLTATLSPYTVGPPTTTTDGESVKFYNGTTLIGSGTLSGGVATLSTTSLPSGTEPLKAVFPGDSNYNTSTSSTINVTVTAIVLSSSPNPSTYQQSVTFTAAVGGGETGTVTFKDGTTVVGSSPIVGTTATFATSSLTIGLHDITAVYSGDTNHAAGSSPILTQEVDKATPTVSVSTSGASSFGGVVTITATLPSGVTGTVTFTSGGVTLGSATVSSGTASITTSVLPVGTDSITASYGGDSNYNAAVGMGSQNVGKATPTVTVTTSGPSTYGGAVSITATLPTGPTGTVTFTSGSTSLGSGTVSGAGVVTISTSVLPAGSDPITATYSGDTNYTAATGTGAQTVGKASPASTLASSLNPSTFGASVTFTDTLPSNVTGTVSFVSGSTVIGTGTVTNGVATASIASLLVGNDPITATYGGDANNSSSVATLTQSVVKATPTVTVTDSGPNTYGGTVTITATVPTGTTGTITITSGGVTLGSGTVNPTTGTVTITTTTLPVGTDTITASYGGDSNNNPSTGSTTDTITKGTPTVTVTTSGPSTYGSPVTITTSVPPGTTGTVTVTSGTTTLGSGTVNPTTGTVTITTTSLPVGSDPITASYGGDSNNNPATGTTNQTVNKIVPTVTVTTSGPSTYGGSVTITTSVPPGTTGTVTVTSGGVTLGSGTVNPTTGTVTITTSTLPVGNDPITASYGGDTNTSPATGSVVQVVSKGSPASTLTSSLNPSSPGDLVTFTDTLPTNVTGTVTFTSGTTVLGTSTVVNGVASVTTSTLSVGSDVITATYNGDSNNNSSLASLTENVAKGTPTVTVTTSGPSTYGGTVTITTSVPPGTTGTVTVTSGGTTLGSGTVNPTTGTVTITTTSLPVGSDPITASYGGDSNNNPSSGSTVQTVTKASPTVTLTSSSNPSTVNQPVTFTATVPSGATGTVTFTDGTTVLGTATITNGVATLTTSSLPSGAQSITATYSGDTNDNPATSATYTQNVNKNTPTLPPPGVSPTSPTAGSPVTITEVVPTGVTGPVTFYDGSTVLGTGAIVNGVATLTVPSLPVGTDSISASTPADANNNAATSPATLVTVAKVTPTLAAPVVSSSNPTAGTPVTITETIPSGVTGTITFYDGTTVIGTAPVVGGSASITVSNLPLGPDPVLVTSQENATDNAATSPSTLVTVAKASTTVTLTSSLNPAPANQTITFTASVPATATGVVTFMDGTTALGLGSVNSSGIATISTSTLSIGSHSITASYVGDVNFGSATSAVLVEVINKASTSVVLTESSSAQLLNSVVTFTANVSSTIPTPTGTVTFLEGTTVLGTAPLSTNGSVTVSLSTAGNAAFAISTLSVGTHQITAIYSGDNSFATSSSLPVSNVVEDFTTTNTGATTQNMFPGGSTSYSFSVAPVGASTFLSGVNLTVSGLPEGSVYTITPATVAAGGQTTALVLNVTTSSSLTAKNRMPGRNAPSTGGDIALGIIGLAGMETLRRRRRQMPRMVMFLLLALASLLPVAGLTGCAGGGYFTLTPTNYTVTVTGTEGSIQHSATATLVVQ
jgi:hypothetical protein